MHEAQAVEKPSLSSRFLHHVMHMPAWHRYVLLGAIAFGAIGTVGRVRQFAAPSVPQQPVTAPGSSLLAADPAAPSVAPTQPWYLSPKFLSTGGSVLGGFVIGWAMRVFVKTTLLVGAAATAIFGSLSYFHVMNVDLTAAQQQYHTDVSWATDQAARLKDIAIEHLPVHAGGLLGMFMGFRRSRM